MTGTSGVTDARRRDGIYGTARGFERDGAPRTGGREAFDVFKDAARDRSRPAGERAVFLVLRPGDDLGSRAPGSVFARLCDRVESSGAGPDRFVEAFARADRESFVRAVEDDTVANAADPEALANLCEDLAARSLENTIVEAVRGDLGAFSDAIERMLSSESERESFMRRLGSAEPDAAREWLERFGMERGEAAVAAMTLGAAVRAENVGAPPPVMRMLPGGGIAMERPAGSFGVPMHVPEIDAQLVEGLLRSRRALGDATRALGEVGNPLSPVNVFADYGPAMDRILEEAGPDGSSYEGSMLEAGVRRAAEERASDAGALATLRTALRVCMTLAAGPFGPASGLALGAALGVADVVRQGANRDRIDGQRRIGVSDDRATGFSTWGEAALNAAAGTAIGFAAGNAALAGGSGRLAAALAGQSASDAYSLCVRLHRSQ